LLADGVSDGNLVGHVVAVGHPDLLSVGSDHRKGAPISLGYPPQQAGIRFGS
jgi:hypothetical protein